jgi:hypothetical protein
LLQSLFERREASLSFCIVRGPVHERALNLLRARRERPCHCAAEQRDEPAPVHHSNTSSARPDTGSGTVIPSALAVLMLRSA